MRVIIPGVPVLVQEQMNLVDWGERERMFKTLTYSDKYNPNLKKKAQDAEESAADEESMVEEDEDVEMLPSGSKVPLYWMEHHPLVAAQVVYESGCRTLVDFTPGGGMLAMAAMTHNFQVGPHLPQQGAPRAPQEDFGELAPREDPEQ